jgi:hypothetical protein
MKSLVNYNRIGLLLKGYFQENLNYEVMLWGILTMIFTFVHQPDFFSTVLNMSGILYAVRQYKSLSHAANGIHFFMIPAKQTEKLFSSIFLTTVYCFVMTILTFLLGSLLGGLISRFYLGTDLELNWDLFTSVSHPSENGILLTTEINTFWSTFSKFATIQAIFLLGSLYFRKNATLKTILSLIAIGMAFTFIELFVIQQTFGEQSAGIQSFSLSISSNNMGSTIGWVAQLGGLVITPYLWLIAYYRLKEREV